MPWFDRWHWLRRIREWRRAVDVFGGPAAFRTEDWTVAADALPAGLTAIHDHESARAFVARYYPIPVAWPGRALAYVLALVVQHVALGERGADGRPPPPRRIDAILHDPGTAARRLLTSPVPDVRQRSGQLEELGGAATGGPGTLESNLHVAGEFYARRWTDWPAR